MLRSRKRKDRCKEKASFLRLQEIMLLQQQQQQQQLQQQQQQTTIPCDISTLVRQEVCVHGFYFCNSKLYIGNIMAKGLGFPVSNSKLRGSIPTPDCRSSN